MYYATGSVASMATGRTNWTGTAQSAWDIWFYTIAEA